MSGIVVIGATGGCGATTIACAIALLQASGGTTPLLVDADLHGGGPVSLWGVEATRRLDDLLRLGGDIGARHLEHLVHRHACGVDVMAGCASAASAAVGDEHAASALAAHAAARECWVADAGRGDTPLGAALVGRADRVVLVTPRSLHGVLRASGVLECLGGRPATPVASALPAGNRLTARALARALACREVVVLGHDPRGAADVAAAHAPRGRGLARALAPLVAPA